MIKYDPNPMAQEAGMGAIERLTITLPSDMAGLVKGAVDEGDYASTSEVIRDALRDWKLKRELRLHKLAELKAEIEIGMADYRAGRVVEFDAERIAEHGRELLAKRRKNAQTGRASHTASAK
jgi:antitoxin ParD1/3/4